MAVGISERTEQLTVYVYEPHPAVGAALRRRLIQTPGVKLVGSGRDPEEARAHIIRLQPRVVIAGLGPGDKGLPLWLKNMARPGKYPAIVALDTAYDKRRRKSVEGLSGTAYVLKNLGWETFVREIHQAAEAVKGSVKHDGGTEAEDRPL